MKHVVGVSFVLLLNLIAGGAWSGPAGKKQPVRAAKADPKGAQSVASQSNSGNADPYDWVARLPSASLVKAAYGGTDEASGAKRKAALAVLQDYIEVRGGVEPYRDGDPYKRVPVPLRARWVEFNEMGGPRLVMRADGTTQLFESPGFRSEVLSRYMSAELVTAYENANLQRSGLLSPSAGPAAKTSLSIIDDSRVSSQAGVDLGVFGMRMSEPFSVPDCPPAPPTNRPEVPIFGALDRAVGAVVGMHERPAQTCVARGAFDSLLQQVLGPSFVATPGLSAFVVYLQPDRCPNWLDQSCTVFAQVLHGYTVGIHFKTANFQARKLITSQLTSKYKRAPVENGEVACVNSLTSIPTAEASVREWNMPGLSVSYTPISQSFNCQNGEIVVQSTTFTRSQRDAVQQVVDGQPKM